MRATVAVTIAANGSKFFGGGGDENITINHGNCGGSGNSDVKSDGDGAAAAAAAVAGAMTAMSNDDNDNDNNDGKGKQGGHDDGNGRHEDSKGRHGDSKRQQGDRRHDDGDGRHDDGKGQQGVRRHDILSVFFFATETERVTQCFLPGGRRHTRGSNGKVGQSGDR